MLKYLGLFVGFSCPLFAHNSLLFSSQEVQCILKERKSKQPQNLKDKESCLECNGLIYQKDGSWTLWLNGEKIDHNHPQCPRQNIKILSLNKNIVHLEWFYKKSQHLISLKPNQYYDAKQTKVFQR